MLRGKYPILEKSMNIRDCKTEDLSQIKKIEKKNFPTPWPIASFKHILQDSSSIFLVAESNSQILGYLVANIERDIKLLKLKTKKESHLLKIAVRKNSRRLGIGTSLMDRWREKVENKDLERLKLEVRVNNENARKFYKKRGFEEIKLVDSYYPDGADAIVMEKKIN